MAALLSLVNRLLPFATPGTPLLQDLVHLAAICLLLYFAPQIQDWNRSRVNAADVSTTTTATTGETIDHDNTGSVAPPDSTVNGHIDPITHNDTVLEQPAPQLNGHLDNGQPLDVENSEDDSADDDATGEDVPTAGNGSVNREVGAKKAKSLARKDQRRAYNEFMRSQGEAQRARDAEGAAEREAVLEAERKRRALVEAELVAKKAREREQKREAEEAERQAEYHRRESAVAIVKADLLARNMSDLHRVARQVGGDVDEEWVEKVIHAAGITGRKADVLTMITTTGWAAKISEADARAFYARAATADISDDLGYVDNNNLSQILVSQLTETPSAACA